MKKIVFLIFFICLITIPLKVQAAYLDNIPQKLTQPDGTIISCFASGDEYHNWAHDENNFTIIQDYKTGWYVYAAIVNDLLVPTSYKVGAVDPAQVGLKPGASITAEEWRKKREAVENFSDNSRNSRTPTTGTINNLVVFIRFNDQTEFPGSYSDYSDDLNAGTGSSLANYYDEVSNGQLDINSLLFPNPSGDVIVSYQDSHDRGYFMPYNVVSNPIGYDPLSDTQRSIREWTLIDDAIDGVSSQIPAGLDFDADNDGQMDVAVFIVRGSPTAWNTLLWPHNWSIQWSDLDLYPEVNGATLVVYNFQMESSIGVGVLCHEMFHALGAPDLYHYTDNGIDPVGGWDLMEWDQDPPQHMLTFMKWKYGQWFSTIPTISTAGTYTLFPVSTNQYSCYKIPSPNSVNEYFMVEYRRQEGTFESSAPGSGLIVYRINTTAGNGNASGPPDEVYIYRPNGTIGSNGSIGNAHFSQNVGRTAIHEFTNPTPFLQNGNAGGLVLFDIGSSDSSISFTYTPQASFFWEGDVSTDWYNSSNWLNNAVPSSSDNVVIPAGTTYSPLIGAGTAYCQDLRINSGATLTQTGTSYFHVNGNFDSDVGTFTQTGFSYLYLGGSSDTHWDDDNEDDTYTYIRVDKANDTASLAIWQDMTVTNNFEVREGIFTIDASWTLTVNSTASNAFEVEAGGTVNLSSGKTINVAGGVEFEDGSRENISGGLIKCGGSLRILQNTLYDITFTGGIFRMDGAATQYIFDQDGGSLELYNLTIAKTGGTCYIQSANLDVNGSIIINNGTLSCNTGPTSSETYDINVAGDWTNYVGIAGFSESSGRVIFDGGNYHQYCSSETFSELEVNKTSGGAFRVNGSYVTCAAYDWSAGAIDVLSGSFTANDLLDNAVQGVFYLNSGGTIDLNNSGTGTWVDLKGDLHIFGGTMTVAGSLSSWPYNEDASIEMNGGVLDFTSCGIYLSPNNTLTETISGGIIRTVGSFTGDRTDFTPSGGKIELYGTADAGLRMEAGSNFYNVLINKTVSRNKTGSRNKTKTTKKNKKILNRNGSITELSRSQTVTATSELDINGYFMLENGVFDTNGNDMYVTGNWSNNVGEVEFVEGNQKVVFDGSSSAAILTPETFYDLHLDKTYAGFAGLETGLGNDNGVDVNVANNLVIYDGTMELNNPTNLVIGNTVTIYSGASINANDTGTINISLAGDWFDYNSSGGFDAGSTSIVTFYGSSPGNIHEVSEKSSFNNIVINSNASYVRPTSIEPLIHCKNMDIVQGKLKIASYRVVVDEALTIFGIVEMASPDDSLFVGDITWESGSTGLITNGLINVSGYWNNSGGSYTPGTSMVVFDSGGDHQDVIGTNTFYDVHQINQNKYLRFNGNTTILHNLELEYFCWAYSSFNVNGTLNIDDPNSKFTTSGSNANATIEQLVQGGTLICNGATTLTVNDLAETKIIGTYYVDTPGGVLSLTNSGTGTYVDLNADLHISGGTMNITGSISYWPYGGDASIVMDSGVLDVTDCGIYLPGTNTLTTSITGGTIRTSGGFTGVRTDFNPTGGTLELYGTSNANLGLEAGSNLYNVKINKSTTDNLIAQKQQTSKQEKIRVSGEEVSLERIRSETVNITSDLDINGNLLIDSGVLNTDGFDMEVYGDWTNSVGDAGFMEETGTVTFNGENSSQITTDETFYNLTADNPTDSGWKVPQIMDNLTINVTNDLNINDGCMKVSGNSIINIGNDLTILEDAGLDMSSYYNQQLNISGDWINENATYTTWIGFYPGSNSTVTFNGNADQFLTTLSAQEDFANLVIDNSGGEFRSNDNIQVFGNLILFDGEWNDNVPSLTHIFHGDFEITSNAAWYTHISPNTVVFAGENDQEFIYNHIGNGYFKNVIINKSTANLLITNHPDQPAIMDSRGTAKRRSQTITMYTDMPIQLGGTLIIEEGTLEVNGNTLRGDGDLTINAGGTLSMSSNSTLWLDDGSELSVDGGNLDAIGTPGNLVNFRIRNTGYYDFEVENGGTIAAEYAQFQHMSSNGVYIRSSGLVDPVHAFNYCTFQNGTPGIAPLIVFNNDQTLICTEVNFPQTGVSDYNAAKASGDGIITFVDAYGNFAGEAYEYDPNIRIEWTTEALSPIDDLTISYNAGTGTIELTWTYPVTVDQFKVYRSTDPHNFTGASVFTTATAGYSEPATGTKYFYRVVAENITEITLGKP